MAKMKRITAALFLALFMCFSFSSIFTVNADELSSDDWEQISLDLQQGDQQSGEDFNFIKNNNGNNDDGEWILYLGAGFVVLGLCGITYAVLSSKRQRALAKKRRAEYIRRMNNQRKASPESRRTSPARNPQQRRPVQGQQQSRNTGAAQSPRGYNQQRRPDSYNSGYGTGNSGYQDNRTRYQNSRENNGMDVYSNSYDNYGNNIYSSGDYNDGYRVSGRNSREPVNDGTRTYNRRPVQNDRSSDQYEDISSFSSSDKNIYSSSTRKNNKYINDYIDY